MIDPRIFIKQLSPDQLGMFEPLSGMMLLNITQAEMKDVVQRWQANRSTESDVKIMHTINHEAYHFAQASASGYVFHRQCRLFRVFTTKFSEVVTTSEWDEILLDPETRALLDYLREYVGDDPNRQLHYQDMFGMLVGHNMLALFNALAPPSDNSLMGALIPGFFAHLKALNEGEAIANTDGLSILGVLEGSAVVHTHLLMHPSENATPHIEAELETLPLVYGELYNLTVDRVGERSLELLLPTVTLALQYAQPHQAYFTLLALLSESASGEATDYGRRLLDQMPEIINAGPLLGTAQDLRHLDDAYRIYDPILDKLANGQWGVDSYDLLAQPAAMHAVESFPMGLVTNDGYCSSSLSNDEMLGRMVLMGMILRSQSRRRIERESRAVGWVRGVIARLMEWGSGEQRNGKCT
jgi:hypothetical protein